jgi:hypothetical protein
VPWLSGTQITFFLGSRLQVLLFGNPNGDFRGEDLSEVVDSDPHLTTAKPRSATKNTAAMTARRHVLNQSWLDGVLTSENNIHN